VGSGPWPLLLWPGPALFSRPLVLVTLVGLLHPDREPESAPLCKGRYRWLSNELSNVSLQT